MASVTKHVLAGSDGYRVLSAAEQLGWVEELWLGAADEPVAAVVRLADERRGLVIAEDVAAVAPDERSLTLAPAARLIRLDPPHVEHLADGMSSATWRATGEVLQLPAEPRHEGPAPVDRLESGQSARRERPVFLTIATLYLVLGGIVGLVIGLDILLAYLVAGSQPN
jgi:hypothetical protein